ncbi:MAG: hypothetical protein ACSHYA_11810 [Opitutaceae bacterium]
MSQQTQESSLSDSLEKLSQCDAVLTLGKKLVDELGIQKSVDTLGRWMCHYIAELIDAAENAQADEAEAKKKLCCDEILKLWEHRNSFPPDKRPFQRFEELEEILKKLDPDNTRLHYFPNLRRPKDDGEKNTRAEKWFDTIEEIDRGSRELIRICLSNAVEDATDKAKEWVSLAQEASLDGKPDVSLVRLFFGENLSVEENPDVKDTVSELEIQLEQIEKLRLILEEIKEELK